MAADFDEEDDAKALDAEIDDLELVYKKKHLCNNYTPLTIISALQGKHKTLSFQESTVESKNTKSN